MRKIAVLAAAAGMAATLAGCADTPRDNAAARGGLIGAASGALIGAAVTGRSSGALVGAAIGGAAGAITGASAHDARRYDPPPARRRCARWAYDYDGNRICREFYYD